MPKQHIVRQGECLSSIAADYGFSSKTIWEAIANIELREKRKYGNILLPGDVLIIPDKSCKNVRGETEKRHRFLRKGGNVMLRLKVNNRSRADIRYILDIDGKLYRGTTNRDGYIEQFISPRSQKGKLVLGKDEQYVLWLGGLDPVSEISGVRERLSNLGYLPEASDLNRLAEAVKQFQKENGLRESGQADCLTQSKLCQIHGS